MSTTPRLTIGLPVYNGGRYLAESLEALCCQTFDDFELIISDNASTDDTAEICRSYEKRDERIRYVRQPVNIGSAANHNFVVDEARGELFKWASHDDLYARELVKRCVDALDEHPEVVLAHAWTAMIDDDGKVTVALEYPLATDSPSAPERFRSSLFDPGGDDFYGVMRAEVLRRVARLGSYYRSDRTLGAELSLYGPFYQVPEWLYFCREDPGAKLHLDASSAERGWPERRWQSARDFSVAMDPRRANRLRHPAVRLYGEYIWGFVRAINRAPLTTADRLTCYRYLIEWMASRAHVTRSAKPENPVRHAEVPVSVDAAVARREPEKW